ncbi:hypothetical protein TNCV_2549331 [Trichonephila clavipes]|nr:hypothetical protein TNCV_2549331 [Trichonephila clavipes]
MNGLPQTAIKSVASLSDFPGYVGDNLFREHLKTPTRDVFAFREEVEDRPARSLLIDGFSTMLKTSMPFINFGSHQGRFTRH